MNKLLKGFLLHHRVLAKVDTNEAISHSVGSKLMLLVNVITMPCLQLDVIIMHELSH